MIIMAKSFIQSFFEVIKDSPSSRKAESKSMKMNYWGLQPIDWKRGLINLKHRGLLEIVGKHYRLTAAGRKWFQKNSHHYFQMRYPKWDKKWRIVIFDIPQKFNKERNRFRYKLKNTGFYMLQKSVFVFPYPCEEEFREICQELKINSYFEIFTTKELGTKEPEVRRYFDFDDV